MSAENLPAALDVVLQVVAPTIDLQEIPRLSFCGLTFRGAPTTQIRVAGIAARRIPAGGPSRGPLGIGAMHAAI
jgi:hypothetical protein